MARDRQLPAFLAKVHPTHRRAGQRDAAGRGRLAGAGAVHVDSRDDGITLLSTLVNFGALTRVPGAARLGGLALRGAPAAAATGCGTWSSPVIGFADPAVRRDQRQRRRPAARLHLARRRRRRPGRRCYATGRRPRARAGGRGPDERAYARVHPTPDESRTRSAAASRCCTSGPGTVVEVSTEDCFGGRVRGVDDLPAQVVRVPVPQPGDRPVLRRGRRARRHAGRALRRDRAGARLGRLHHVPALRGADRPRTARRCCTPPLEERVWVYDIDVARGHRAATSARRGDFTVELPLDPMHGTVGVAPAAGEVLHDDHAGRARRQHGHPGAARRA